MSRQNSMDVASLEVTVNGSQVSVDPIGNGTKPFDDVKVMLVKGIDGTGAESLALEFDPAVLYAVGDLCTKDGYLYECIHAHHGEWDSSDFRLVRLEILLDEKVNKTGDTMSGALRVDDTDYTSPIVTQSFTTYDGKFTMSFSTSGAYSISYKDSESSYSGITDTIGLANRASRYHVMVYNSTGTTLLTEREMSNVSQKAVTFDAGSGSTSVIVKVYKYGYSEINAEHILANVVEDGGGNVLSEKLETSAFKRIRRKVTASNWSASRDANGFYTYTLNAYQNFHNEPTPKVYGSGANDTTLPTDAEAKAYEQIIFPNGYVEHYSVNTFKLYAKEKPTTDFYVVIEGIYWQ